MLAPKMTRIFESCFARQANSNRLYPSVGQRDGRDSEKGEGAARRWQIGAAHAITV